MTNYGYIEVHNNNDNNYDTTIAAEYKDNRFNDKLGVC